MRILFLSQVLPYPLDAGPKMRSYFVLRYLTQKHQVTLLTFIRATDRPEDIEHLAQFCDEVHPVLMYRNRVKDVRFLFQSILTGQPFLIARDYVPEMVDKIEALLKEISFDAVHADQLWMAQYAQEVKKFCPDISLTLDQHNAVFLIPKRLADGESNPVKRWFFHLESTRLKRYESTICDQFDDVVWVTDEDRQEVNPQSIGSKSSSVIPICVEPTPTKVAHINKQQPRITFLGGLHWPPNAQGIVWFFKEIFPHIKAEIPETILTVIGKNPPSELYGNSVETTGYVPDLEPYLKEPGVFIVPLLAGGGMRVKILDAWNWGIPIVSTTIGAEGIIAIDQVNMLIADSPNAFAKATIRLLKEPELAMRLVENGRQTLKTQYNWKTIYRAWDKIYPND
jgi:glycosyltransferase involved in cell wall biosynthesis